jgi:hypothetical protein
MQAYTSNEMENFIMDVEYLSAWKETLAVRIPIEG